MVAMGIPRRTRLFASMIAIVALVFSQLAVSAFACPMTGMAPDMEMSANLCERHCDYGNASLDQAKGAAGVALAVQGVVRIAAATLPPQPQVTARTLRATWLAAGPAPPLIGTTVLRI
jgi:hypothetical protein